MTYEAAIFYAKQRMREHGKLPHQYHFEPVRIVGTPQELEDGLIEFNAYNELYILVYPNKYYGVAILSDNSTFYSDDHNLTGVIEYTGKIYIKKIADTWNLERREANASGVKPRPIPIEFLRVVIY